MQGIMSNILGWLHAPSTWRQGAALPCIAVMTPVLFMGLQVGRQGLQQEPSGQRVEEALRRCFPLQGHRAGEDVGPGSI